MEALGVHCWCLPRRWQPEQDFVRGLLLVPGHGICPGVSLRCFLFYLATFSFHRKSVKKDVSFHILTIENVQKRQKVIQNKQRTWKMILSSHIFRGLWIFYELHSSYFLYCRSDKSAPFSTSSRTMRGRSRTQKKWFRLKLDISGFDLLNVITRSCNHGLQPGPKWLAGLHHVCGVNGSPVLP